MCYLFLCYKPKEVLEIKATDMLSITQNRQLKYYLQYYIDTSILQDTLLFLTSEMEKYAKQNINELHINLFELNDGMFEQALNDVIIILKSKGYDAYISHHKLVINYEIIDIDRFNIDDTYIEGENIPTALDMYYLMPKTFSIQIERILNDLRAKIFNHAKLGDYYITSSKHGLNQSMDALKQHAVLKHVISQLEIEGFILSSVPTSDTTHELKIMWDK